MFILTVVMNGGRQMISTELVIGKKQYWIDKQIKVSGSRIYNYSHTTYRQVLCENLFINKKRRYIRICGDKDIVKKNEGMKKQYENSELMNINSILRALEENVQCPMRPK